MRTPILEIRDLCVQVNGQTLLNHLDLTIPEGEVHALLGQNGSGKTSLMMTVMGFSNYAVTQGQILFRGQDITHLSVGERARLGIGIAQQRPPTIRGVTLRSLMMYVLRDVPDAEKKLTSLAEATHMEPFLDRSLNDGLSGGEIKRAELFQLLALNPAFAMMDEPDSGVDMEAMELVGTLINQLFASGERQRNAGLIITHNGNMLKYVHIDQAHILYKGGIGCSGSPEKIVDQVGRCGYEACVRCMVKG